MKKIENVVYYQVRSNDLYWIEKISAVYCQIWQEPPWNEYFWIPAQVVKEIRRELRKKNASCFIAVRLDNNQAIGFTWGYQINKKASRIISSGNQLDKFFESNESVFYVDELAINSQYRKRGIGGSLSAVLVKDLIDKGAKTILLRTDINAEPAKRLYQGLGFADSGITDGKHKARNYWCLRL